MYVSAPSSTYLSTALKHTECRKVQVYIVLSIVTEVADSKKDIYWTKCTKMIHVTSLILERLKHAPLGCNYKFANVITIPPDCNGKSGTSCFVLQTAVQLSVTAVHVLG